MPNSIGSDGLEVKTQAELVSEFTTNLQTIYGSDINLDQDSPDGQWMMIIIQAILDLEDLLVQIYNNFDPDKAFGVVLDSRVSYNGIQRQAGTYSTTDIVVVTSASSLNLDGLDQSTNPVYTVSDSQGNQWQLITSQSGLTAGTHTLSFRSATPGANLATPNTIIVQVTVVLGVTSVNNPNAQSLIGLTEESDAALKIRRQKSVTLSSQGYLAGLLAALENINGVASALVFENNTDGTVSTPLDVPSHSIMVIIDGTPTDVLTAWNSSAVYNKGDFVSFSGNAYGSIVDNNQNHAVSDTDFWREGGTVANYPIAKAIYEKRNAGCGLFGTPNFTMTQIDGSAFVISWIPVQEENLYIQFEATSLNGTNSPRITDIKSQLPTLLANGYLGVSQQLNVNELATLVQQIDSNTLVSNAGLSYSSIGPFESKLAPFLLSDKFAVSASRIVITPIIISPASVNILPLGTQQFSTVGGQTPYVYSMFTNVSGGSVNPSTGIYTAGVAAGTDVVKVLDNLGNTAFATVVVT